MQSINDTKPNNDILLFKSKPPILFYLSILAILVLTITFTLHGMPWSNILIYLVIVFILLFKSLANYSCIVYVYKNKLDVKYLMFWHKNKTIIFNSKPDISIKWNYWSFKLYEDYDIYKAHAFYNILIINSKRIKINTRIGYTKKILMKLKGDN